MNEKLGDQHELVSTSEYPHAKFPFGAFNPVQSRVFELYNKEVNCLIAAKTSAGKTICAEMFMAQEVRERGGKAVYLAPLRALAKEKIDDWSEPDHHFADLNQSICTGDYRLTEARKKELSAADIIIMTTEMMNSYPYETSVFCHKNGNVWLDKIGRLVEEEIDCDVFSYHDKKGVIPTPITGRINCGKKEVYKLELVGGREVKMTKDHNVYRKKGKNIEEVKLKDIDSNDLIAISKGFITPSVKSEIDLLPILRKSERRVFVKGAIVDKLFSLSTEELHCLCPLGSGLEKDLQVGTSRRKKFWLKRKFLPLSRMTEECLNLYGHLIDSFVLYHSNKEYSRFLNINENKAYFLGFYAAEGSVCGNHVVVGQKYGNYLEKARSAFGGEIRESKQTEDFFYLDICDSLLGEICKEFGPNANNKKCPNWLFSFSSKEINSFLQGFLDGDGSQDSYKEGEVREENKNNLKKRYWSSSKELLEGLRNLLILTDRQGHICKSSGDMWSLGEWSTKHPWLGNSKKPSFEDLSLGPMPPNSNPLNV